MGLLDDAIREHLDLKRRRGADPAEVARLEQEALGPVRREPPAQEPAAAAEAAVREQDDASPETAHADRPHPAQEGLHPEEHAHVLAPEDRHEPPHGDPLRERTAEREPAPAPEPAQSAPAPEPEPEPAPPAAAESPQEPEAREPEPRHADVVDQPTTEYRVEDHHGGPEDVLEETPDFLQETPEHDRLWFEQRPPRDFDFDG